MTKCRTDDTSAFNTRTARRRLPCLDPARREGEVEEDSVQQQHNGVVMMEERGNPAGLRQALRERRKDLGEGEGCASTWVRLPSHPLHIYRGKGEGGRPPQIPSEEGAAARRGSLPPKAKG